MLIYDSYLNKVGYYFPMSLRSCVYLVYKSIPWATDISVEIIVNKQYYCAKASDKLDSAGYLSSVIHVNPSQQDKSESA